jgi:hypothetical protein
MSVSKELFNGSDADKNFLKNVITGDETWVYGYDIETKAQSSQWKGKSSPRQKKTKSIKCEGVAGLFFYWKGVIHHEFVPHD